MAKAFHWKGCLARCLEECSKTASDAELLNISLLQRWTRTPHLWLQGVRHVATLAKQCRGICGLTHVSSAYVTGGSGPGRPAPETLVEWRTPEGQPADPGRLAAELSALPPQQAERRVRHGVQVSSMPPTHALLVS
jgi:hypothetical protein